MKTIEKKYHIINTGLIQRQKLLADLNSARVYYENLSDFGWFLTLGSEAFGMLTAVSSGKTAREIETQIKKLENEICFLEDTKKELNKMM